MLETSGNRNLKMATKKNTLKALQTNIDESIGLREHKPRARLSPVAAAKDVGRRPLRNVGCIAIDQVMPDPSQPRSEFLNESIQRLANSIRDNGQLAPIRVRWSAEHQKWIIVCGERRWRASQAAKLATIDCYFDESDLGDAAILEQQMIENLLREDLSPIEQARGFSALMELNDWNGKQVAESLHIPASTVSRALSLLDLPVDIQKKVEAGQIAARSAYEISKIPSDRDQRDLVGKVANGMTLKQTQAKVRKQTQRRSSAEKTSPTKRLEFIAENGWRISATPPKDDKRKNYHDLKEAIAHAQEDIQIRIDNNIRIG